MENTKSWDRYQRGLNFKSKINLLPIVDKNERFYAAKQWEGIKANGLPTPVLNVIKRIIDYKISAIMSDTITMQFSADGIDDTTENEQDTLYRQVASILTGYSKTLWENLKVDSMNEDGLLDAALSGDMVSFWYWNDKVDAGNGQKGDINGELIDNVNYFPGDPNTDEINDAYGPVQPYIILAFRRQVSDVREEAKENGASEQDLKNITADGETQNQAGDRAKTELEADGEDGKCIVLLEMWDEPEKIEETDPVTGKKYIKSVIHHIMAKRSTRAVTTRPKWDTDLHRYPVALMNWYKRKGSAHGEAEATGLISNQIMINQQAAMMALWIKLHGFPRVIYDKIRINAWNNDLSKAIPVNGSDAGGVNGAAAYMQPAQISGAVMQFMEWFIQITKDMAGANDAALGEASPTNTSAIQVLQRATAVPLNSIRRRFYKYDEDIGLIELDFFVSKYAEYPKRMLEITKDNVKQVVPFDATILQKMKLKLKIDVGPSTQWNEASAAQTLDNLLMADRITFIEYLKRLSNGLIPDRQGLIDDRESKETAQRETEKQLMYELMARFVDTLPPETLKQLDLLKQNDPAQYEQQVKALIQQSPAQQPQAAQPKQETAKTPSESISYKDIPPEAQVQMLAQAGIQTSPQAIVQNQATQQALKPVNGGGGNGVPTV
jgi:hypothetical protein